MKAVGIFDDAQPVPEPTLVIRKRVVNIPIYDVESVRMLQERGRLDPYRDSDDLYREITTGERRDPKTKTEPRKIAPDDVVLTDLPPFVQRRAYDKGVAVARIVRDPLRRFGQATIEGTRVSPFDIAGELEEPDERIAETYSLTVEQVVMARAWLAAHPECPNARHDPRSRSTKKCPDCDDHGYVYSADEMAEIRLVDEQVRAVWERLHAA